LRAKRRRERAFISEANRFSVSPMTHPSRRRSVKCISWPGLAWPGASQPKLSPYLVAGRPSLLAACPFSPFLPRIFSFSPLGFAHLLRSPLRHPRRVYLSGAHARETSFPRLENVIRRITLIFASRCNERKKIARGKHMNLKKKIRHGFYHEICNIFTLIDNIIL